MLKCYIKRSLLLLFPAMVLGLAMACGGDDSDSSSSSPTDDTPTEEAQADNDSGDGSFEMVPLSSLGLDLPFEFSYDPPVPSDASVNRAIEREATANTHGGYDLTLDTAATFEEMQAAYDEYVAEFEFSQAIPASQAWSGRRAEGEPSITIAVIGERLNIAEILDN